MSYRYIGCVREGKTKWKPVVRVSFPDNDCCLARADRFMNALGFLGVHVIWEDHALTQKKVLPFGHLEVHQYDKHLYWEYSYEWYFCPKNLIVEQAAQDGVILDENGKSTNREAVQS